MRRMSLSANLSDREMEAVASFILLLCFKALRLDGANFTPRSLTYLISLTLDPKVQIRSA